VSLEAGGVTLAGEASQSVEIPANGERVLRWTATATDAAQADLVFSVKSGEYSDASKPRLSTAPNGGLRINRWSAPETVGTAGELVNPGTRNEAIGVPPNLDKTQGNLIIKLDPSLAASMQDGLRYVEGWEYDCAEQTVSKFLPNVLTYRALQRLGIENKELQEKLPNEVARHLERLYLLQNADGGWGWWRNEQSNASVSAYALFGMLKAREAGFEVRDEVYQRALAFIVGQSKTLTLQSTSQSLDAQTWLEYVLAEAGSGDGQQVESLYGLRGNLSQYGKALLILTMGKTQPTDARIKTLFADLNAKVIQSATGAHWEEGAPDWWSMNTDTRSTALVLAAYANYDKNNSLAPNIVRWLMTARKANGAWSSTYETAWVLIALTDWMAATGELDANYTYGAQFNGATLGEATASRATITQGVVLTVPASALSTETLNRLSIARGEGKGRLYYTAHLNAYLPVPSIQAADRGIVIQRRYVKAECAEGVKCPSVSEAKVGDVLRVELTIIAPSALHYLQVEDPLPAGAEAIDTTLATASQLDEGPQLVENRPEGERAGQPFARRWFWYWGWWSRSEMRDDKAAVFATYLPAGTYTYSYTMRVTSAGKFNVIPAYARLQYFPEVFGRSEGALLSVTR
jgi:alpha-2-macroglobulin